MRGMFGQLASHAAVNIARLLCQWFAENSSYTVSTTSCGTTALLGTL
jgi:hypothetical protein